MYKRIRRTITAESAEFLELPFSSHHSRAAVIFFPRANAARQMERRTATEGGTLAINSLVPSGG